MSSPRLSSPLLFVALLGATLSSSPVCAQEASGWYAGLQAGWQQLRFQPHYTFLRGGPPSQFDNRQSGLQWDVLFGHRTVLTDQWAIRLEGGAGFNRTTWSLDLADEPAAFEYTMPYDVRAAVLPERRLGRRTSVFGSLGLGAGHVREVKAAPTSSRYDVARTRPMFVAGGGVLVALSSRVQLRGEYRFRRLGAFGFDTVNPAGDLIERVRERPSAHAVLAGITVGL